MIRYLKKTQKSLVFRKYTRKKFAVFFSLGKQIKIAALCVASTLIVCPVQGQSKTESDTISPTYDLEEVEVVGQKSTVLPVDLPRMIELISVEEITQAPAQSYHDFIEYRSNIDINHRGPFGTQADVSIRSGSFDQTLILLNGINLSDPQTGHHSLSLPIDLETISKIEILNGSSSRALGANAYSGAINIVALPKSNNQVNASVHLGEYGFQRYHLGTNFVTKTTKHLITLGYNTSTGYVEDTDFDNKHLFYSGEYSFTEQSTAFLYFGLNNKAFGANGFYHPRFTEQYETTRSTFAATGIKTKGAIQTKTQIYWRRNGDEYILIRSNPAVYTNHHLTNTIGTDFTASHRSQLGKTTFGSGIRSENILSNSLGVKLDVPVPVSGTDSAFYLKQASRNNFEVYIEHVYQSEKWFLSGGAMTNWNNFAPTEVNFFPGIDIRYTVIQNFSVISSYNYSLGMPTFTDLYYVGPTNFGNEALMPYNQHSAELGLSYLTNILSVKVVGFYTQGENNIDWVLNEEAMGFTSINVPHSINRGVEVSMNYAPDKAGFFGSLLDNLYAGYTFIDTSRDLPANISKYSNIRQKFSLTLQHKFLKNICFSWNLLFKERIGDYLSYNFIDQEIIANPYPEILLVNAKVNYKFHYFGIYLEGNNLFDVEYFESGSVPQPGRWIRGGVTMNFSNF
ncbi:MAG: TonB-dependent receptor [Bacteroidales bacterium]|nr:TonB-dependent receptor [Bacteroidales bacterium]MBN2821002.1 TonB-dependent receptor [Bacteroidales bacterium]